MSVVTAAQLSKDAKAQMSKDPEGALQLAMEASRLAELEDDGEALSESLFVMGVSNHRLGRTAEALDCFSRRMELVSKTGDPAKISAAHNNLGNVLCSISDFGNAIEHFFSALKILEELNDEQRVVATKINLGVAFQNLNRLDEALNMFEDALSFASKNGDVQLKLNSHLNLGAVLNLQKKLEEAYFNDKEAYLLSIGLEDKFKQAEILNNIGANEVEREMYPEALATFEQALALCREQHLSVYELRCLLNIGLVNVRLGNAAEAEVFLKEALQMAEAKKDRRAVRAAYKHLSELYEQNGDMSEALGFYKKYIAVKEEVLNMQNLQQLGQLQLRYEMDKKAKEAEIGRLRHVELKLAFDNLQTEKKKSEALLLNILPEEVAAELKEKGYAEAKLFENATVLFTDFVNFTRISERLSPQELVGELDACFRAFDEIIQRYNIEKIKTVGDAYMAVSGLPVENPKHAEDIVNAALDICDFIQQRKKEKGDKSFDLRIGINSGRVVAGIVGMKKFAYDIWGDTVNVAARMEQSGEPGKINISEGTYRLVKDVFDCEYRGEIEAKNKGRLKMYFVNKE